MLYFICAESAHEWYSVGEHIYKIGYSVYGGANRLSVLQIGNPVKLRLDFEVEGDRETEKLVHEYLSDYRVNGEWFRANADNIRYFDYLLMFFDDAYHSADNLEGVPAAINENMKFLIKLKKYDLAIKRREEEGK